jgi:hypothetical protein
MNAIQRALKLIRAHIVDTGADPGRAIEHLWSKLDALFTPDDRQYLMVTGLRELSSTLLAGDRGGLVKNSIIQAEVSRYQAPPKDVWVSVMYETPERYKPILDFTPDDCQYVADKHRQQSRGLLEIAVFLEQLRETMLVQHAATAKDLSNEIRTTLASQWPVRDT